MSPVLMIALVILAPALCAGAIVWRRQLLLALPFLVILNGVALPVGGSSVRLDQVAACLLFVPLAASLLTGRRRLVTDAIMWLLGAILAANIAASALNSPARAYSLFQCANLASVWIIYVLLINFLDSRREVEAFFHCCVWAAMIAGGIGIAAYCLAIAGIPLGGAEVSQSAAERLTLPYGAYGTMSEPNIFGSLTAAHLVLALALLVIAARLHVFSASVTLLRWLAVVSAVGLVLSFTRAAWIGAVVGAVCFAVLASRTMQIRIRLRRSLGALAALAAVLLLLTLAGGIAGNFLRFKLLNLFNFESTTAVVRLAIFGLALQQTLVHPIVGWGTFTFAALAAEGADFRQFEGWRNLWIGNFLLLALHDTGVIGLALWLGLIVTILTLAIRAVRTLSVSDPVAGTRALALTAAVVSLFVSFLSTSGFSFGYTWLLIGLLGAHVRLARGDRTELITPPPDARP